MEINIRGGVAGGFLCSPNASLGSLRELDLCRGAERKGQWDGRAGGQ